MSQVNNIDGCPLRRARNLLQAELGPTRHPLVLKAMLRLWRGRHDGKRALVYIRLAQFWMAQGNKRRALWMRDRLRREFGCYVSLSARIGYRVKLPHPVGIVIGDGVEIGDDCTIFQHVTMGAVRLGEGAANRYPRLREGVAVFAGACILGDIEIGAGAVIGGNSVVRFDVPPNMLAAGVPAELKKAVGR